MPVRSRLKRYSTVAQDSPLLSLPPELRNKIYEFVAQDEKTFSVRRARALYCPPLSLVCRQIRHEYEQIYLHEAPQVASRINVHITDFTFKGVSSLLENFTAGTPEKERSYLVRVFLTNVWSPLHIRSFCNNHVLNEVSPRSRYRDPGTIIHPYAVEVHFDPRTFDFHSCRQLVERFDWCLKRCACSKEWLQVKDAFADAFERYAPTRPVVRVKRKRKAGRQLQPMATKRRK